MPEILEPPIPDAEDWAAVELLIRDVQEAESKGKSYAASIVFWNMAVRLFHQAERILLFEQRPSPEDLKMHEAFLHALLGLGQLLEMRIQNISDDDLSRFGIQRENLNAYNRELKDTFALRYTQELGEVPQSFFEALADFDAGRFVPMETALNEPPPGRSK